MRTPMVSRTIVTTKAQVLCVDTVAQETLVQEFTLPRTYKDNNALMKAITASIDENSTIKAVAVQSTEEVETLYGMTEQEFITLAKVLPPRGTKAEAEEDNTVADAE